MLLRGLLWDLAGFLVGRRVAIERWSVAPFTLELSAILVLSASLARRYDQVYLPAEPWSLVMPAVVSWVNATLLFGLLWVTLIRRCRPRPLALGAWRTVLALFWLTAPLAWLYAIPVERFLDPYRAMQANLWLLLIVAAWRVALTARVVQVLCGIGGWTAFFVTMVFSDSVAVVLMIASPKPIVPLMGGIEHSAPDELLVQISYQIINWGVMLFPVWVIGASLLAAKAKPRWTPTAAPAPESRPALRRTRWLAWATVLAWAAVLPFTQSEQRLAWQVDQALADQQVDQAVALMSSRPRADFPPVFDPRPKLWGGKMTPDPWQILDVALEQDAPAWVIDLYVPKAEAFLASSIHTRLRTPEQVRYLLSVLPRLEEAPRIAAEHLDEIGRWILLVEQTEADARTVERIHELARQGGANL